MHERRLQLNLMNPCSVPVPGSVLEQENETGMGVDHGEDRGDKSPQKLERGDANANCPPRFCHIGTKTSVLWPSKYTKIRSAPDPAVGAHDAPPDPLVGWRGDTPPHTPPHSAPTHIRRSPCVPPKVQQIYAYGNREHRNDMHLLDYYITLHYGDKCFQRKNCSHFTRVKHNRKNEFSVDV